MKVIHYISKKHGLLAIKNQRLKVALYDDLNDPFELYGASAPDLDTRKTLDHLKSDFIRKYGLLCFSKTWRNPVMWGHYADRHKGLALEFEVPKEGLIEMKYKSSRLHLDIRNEMRNPETGKKLIKKLLETKFLHWKYEQEMRMHVVHDKTVLENGARFYKFGDDLELKRIFIGPLCRLTDSEIETRLLPNTRIRTANTRLAFKTFRVVLRRSQPERWISNNG